MQKPPSKVRKVFVFFLVFLPLQYGVIGIYGHYGHIEPWPAFVFPGFKNVYDGEKGITLNYPELSVVHADSSKQAVTVPELLSDVPHSHHRAIMVRRFNSTAAKNLDSETKQWLYDKLTAVLNRADIVRLEVTWRNDFYQLSNGEVITETEVFSRNNIYFDEKL